MTTELATAPPPLAPHNWKALLRDVQAADANLSPEQKIAYDKARASVRIYEKMNLNDRRPLSAISAASNAALVHNLSAADASRVLQARIEKWKRDLRQLNVPSDDGQSVLTVDAELLYHRIWQGQMPQGQGSPVMVPDGWIYMEAYFYAPNLNVTYRAIIAPDASVLAY